MMLQEEFSRLIYLYQQASEGKLVSVEDVFHKSLEFVEHLKLTIRNGDAEDKAAALRMMRELFSHMQKQTRIVCEKSGMTEEQLTARSENPANFSPEQWQSMQAAKGQLAKSGIELSQIIEETESKQAKTTSPAPAPVPLKEPGKPGDVKPKKPKKSQWMRS